MSIANSLRSLFKPRTVNVQRRGVRVPLFTGNFKRPAYFIPRRIEEHNLNSYTAQNTVLRKYELVAVDETGQFKVGDGVTPFKDLPWADRLPVVDYTEKQELI